MYEVVSLEYLDKLFYQLMKKSRHYSSISLGSKYDFYFYQRIGYDQFVTIFINHIVVTCK
jgi:hypothetical protein